ncbi:MAG: ABC transporter permease [Myxococcales bacterium]|nr:ABC transporter permease [Myxococcales bacterium]
MLDLALFAVIAAQLLRVAMPYLGAALCGGINEASGTIDVALEGKLLIGAFAAATAAHATGSPAVGTGAALCAVMALTALQGWLCIRLAADQVLVGIGLNMFAAGITRYLLHVLYGTTANSPQGPRLASLAENPLFYMLALGAFALPWIFASTPFGMRLRAAGGRPASLAQLGLSPLAVRWQAMLLSCYFAALGGAALSLSLGKFVSDMSGGRGYVAMAAVILGNWQPRRIALWCLAFAALESLGSRLQMHTLPGVKEFLVVLPHVAVLLVLGFWPARRSANKLHLVRRAKPDEA